MELGNMVWGNSRGNHSVNRDMQDEWYSYMEELGFDSYGWHEKSGQNGAFENEVFWLMPYYWGDCTCGFENKDWQWSKDNKHAEDCYQSELEREKIKAGGVFNSKLGWVERPESIGYSDWEDIKRGIYDRLCAQFKLDPKYGCAVHCTCSYDNDYAKWREENDHATDCPVILPNFWHKPSGFKLDWYKYPLRDSYSSEPLTRELMRKMWADCKASLKPSKFPEQERKSA